MIFKKLSIRKHFFLSLMLGAGLLTSNSKLFAPYYPHMAQQPYGYGGGYYQQPHYGGYPAPAYPTGYPVGGYGYQVQHPGFAQYPVQRPMPQLAYPMQGQQAYGGWGQQFAAPVVGGAQVAVPGQMAVSPAAAVPNVIPAPLVPGGIPKKEGEYTLQMTALQKSIGRIREKIQKEGKHGLKSLIRTDVKLFEDVMHDFNGIAGTIATSGLDLLWALESDKDTVKRELEALSTLMVDIIEGGRESTDQDQFRPFSVRDYDHDSATIKTLNLASRSMMALIESEGFVLAMEHLGLLKGFIKTCKVMLRPPFLPTMLSDPVDGDTPFRTLYDDRVNTLNQVAVRLQSGDFSVVKTAPQSILDFLEQADLPTYSLILNPMGFKEKTEIGYKIDMQAMMADPTFELANARAAEITKDILRDVMAEGLVDLLTTASEIFISRVQTSTLFRVRDASLKHMVATALRNVFEAKKAPVLTTTAEGEQIHSQRSIILNKAQKRSRRKLEEWYTKAVDRYGESSGLSSAELEIKTKAREAEDLLETGAAEGLIQLFSSKQKMAAKYIAGTRILADIFASRRYMEAFKGYEYENTVIFQVSDQTVEELYKLLEDAYEDTRTALRKSRGKSYETSFANLMRAVNSNKPFLNRLGKLNTKYLGRISKMSMKYSAGGIGGTATGAARRGSTARRLFGFAY